MTASSELGGAVLGPSRLPPNRPNTCQTIDCHNGVRVQVISPGQTRILWVCVRCSSELTSDTFKWRRADGFGGVKR